MTGYLTDYGGQRYELPVLRSWDLQYGAGEPCDAFEIGFLYDPDMAGMLAGALRFSAAHEGETVFVGAVDETEVTADGGGLRVSVSGRSMAARLLDNEAEAAAYYNTGLDFILDRHVRALGIEDIESLRCPALAHFSVASGDSHWTVLRDFLWESAAAVPRFSRGGKLLLSDPAGDRRRIDGSTAVTAALWRDRRYGVLSDVRVRSRASGAARDVTYDAFKARGGQCARVLSVPRTTTWSGMESAGKYQIARSAEGSRVCVLTLASAFAAFPGDEVELRGCLVAADGNYRVTGARCRGGADGVTTQLTLVRKEDLYVAI